MHEMIHRILFRTPGRPIALVLAILLAATLATPLAAGQRLTDDPSARPQPESRVLPSHPAVRHVLGTVLYSDRTTFNAENPGLPVEDFEAGNVPPGGVLGCDAPTNSTTNDACWAPGDILPGIEISDSPGPDASGLVLIGAGFNGNPSIHYTSNTFLDSYVVTFDPPVTAVGGDLVSHFNPDTVTIDVFDASAALIISDSAPSTNTGGSFWGIQSTTPIGSIVLTTPTNQVEGFDDLAFGQAPTGVPQTFCSTPGVAIPDNNPTGVTDTLVVPAGGSLSDLDLTLDVSHTWVGDVALTLTHVDTGTTITPYDRPGVPASTFGCSSNDVLATVNDEGVDGNLEDTCLPGPPGIVGDLVGGDPPSATLFAAFDGEDFAGTWTLTATDAAGGDTGTLNEWCLVGTASEPAEPAITLDKTVGTSSGVCATTDTIDVVLGTPVTYCYTVTNTGNVTLNYHTVVDDQLGTLVENLPFALVPGASAFFTVDDVLLATTTVNNATWTAFDESGQTACAGSGITITGGTPSPYPSTLVLAGAGAAPSRIDVAFDNFAHTWPDDVDALLVGPGGETFVVMSDAGGSNTVTGVNLDLTDLGPVQLPDEDPLTSGPYRPADYGGQTDNWPPPAPPPPYGEPAPTGSDTLASIFGGVDPNGTWSLYFSDAFPAADDGSISDWCVTAVSASGSASASDSATVNVLIPDIVVDPTSLSSFQEVDTTVDLPLDISNVGDADLIWDITEDAGLQRAIVRVPGREKMLRPNRPSVRPEPNEVKSGSQTFSRAEATGEARTVTPQRGEVPDATVTITHSATQNIVTGNSVACNAGGLHTDNSYIREFDLAGFGISGQFAVTQVEVGIEQAFGAGGSQPADVNLYLWNPADPFTFANFVPIGGVSATVPDQALTIVTVPVTGTAPAGSHLVVEFFTPNGQTAGNSLFVGSNPDGQTAPTYLAAADCGVPEPLDTAVIGFPNMHLVMNVTGTTGCDADLPWVSTNPSSGTTVAGGTDTVTVTFDSTGLALGEVLTGALCVNSNDPDTPELQVPLTLEVDTMPFLDGFETGDTSRWSYTTP